MQRHPKSVGYGQASFSGFEVQYLHIHFPEDEELNNDGDFCNCR